MTGLRGNLKSENSSIRSDLWGLYETIAPKFSSLPEKEKNYLVNHTIDTTYYSSQIAESIRCSQKEVRSLETAALLFDIGKTEIPVGILTKKDPLTLNEYWTIQGHPFFSEMLIKSLPDAHKLIPIIRKHHERMDGCGYPVGWKDGEICLPAKILAVADSYAAMRSNTSYRKALSKKDAVKELERERGKQFDSNIVDEFVKILNRPQKSKLNALFSLPLLKLQKLKHAVPCSVPLQSVATMTGLTLVLSFSTAAVLANSDMPKMNASKETPTKVICKMNGENAKLVQERAKDTSKKQTSQSSKLSLEKSQTKNQNQKKEELGKIKENTTANKQRHKPENKKQVGVNMPEECTPKNQYCEPQALNEIPCSKREELPPTNQEKNPSEPVINNNENYRDTLTKDSQKEEGETGTFSRKN